jgi:hypothetical protein
LNDSTIINETLEEEDMTTEMLPLQDEDDESNFSTNTNETISKTSVSMSEQTLMLSDCSDDEDLGEFYSNKEKKYELKKKLALERTVLDNDSLDTLNDSSMTCKHFNPLDSSESWFTP